MGDKGSFSSVKKQTTGQDHCEPNSSEKKDDFCEESDEDPLSEFTPLNADLYYFISDAPPALEVVRTQDIESVRIFIKPSFLGIPYDLRINTSHIGKSAKKITRKHAQYALAAGMMLGMREVIGGVEGLAEAELNEEENPATYSEKTFYAECARVRKYKFPPNLSFEGGKALPYSYDFKAYAPLVFARIRSAFGVQKNLFLHSICGNFNFIEFMSNAKSGKFFFFSHDGRYMIKTQTTEECKFLQAILPNYYQYLMENPNSFLTHFYGLYRVKIPETHQQIHFCIMRSVFNTEHEIHKIWDLKGSTKGRSAKPGETVLKDLDILEEGRKLQLGAEKKEAVMSQLRRDATFMARLGIMDYSLLIGVHEVDKEQRFTHGDSAGDSDPKSERMRSNIPSRNHNLDRADNINTPSGSFSSQNDGFPLCHVESSLSDAYIDCVSVCSGDTSSTAPDSPCRVRALSPNTVSEISAEKCDPLDQSAPIPIHFLTDDNGIESHPQQIIKNEKYFCGIIDILQNYNAIKWGETVVKKAVGNSESEISCVDPETYAIRFVKFISNLIE